MPVLVVLLAGKEPRVVVVAGLSASDAHPSGNREGVADGLGIVGRDGEVGQVGGAEGRGALAAVADGAGHCDAGGRRGRPGRRGGEPVARRIGDRSTRLRHVPDADVAGERAFVADGLAARSAAPAHHKLGAVGHRGQPHPDQGFARRVPRVDFEREAVAAHVDEAQVGARGRILEIGVGEAGGRVRLEADQHREAGKRRLPGGIAGHRELCALGEGEPGRPRQRGGGRQGEERNERGEEGGWLHSVREGTPRERGVFTIRTIHGALRRVNGVRKTDGGAGRGHMPSVVSEKRSGRVWR